MSAAVVAALSLSGCSTIVEGRSQVIAINTQPPGASCVVTRHGETLGKVEPTPGSIRIEKTKYDLTIACDKEGYAQATRIDRSGVDAATVGNVILGGGIGWAIDSATGSDNKYDSPVTLTLARQGSGDDSAASRPPSAAGAVASPATAPTSAAAPSAQTLSRTVFNAKRQKIGIWYQINPDCTSRGYPILGISTSPAHGNLTFAQDEDFTEFTSDNQRYHCNVKRSPVSVAYYESTEGYAGEDTAIVDVVYPTGSRRLTTFKILVK